MKLFLSFLICIFFSSIALRGQNFEVPEDPELKNAEDYSRYEKDVIAAANWLKQTPFNEQVDKRKAVNKFVLQWIMGSPTVNVELNPTIFDFDKKNVGMMPLYMACCAQYVLENNYSKDMIAKQKVGLKAIEFAYKQSKGLKKDKKIEQLIKSDEEGKLDEWISENLKVNQ